MQLVPMSNALMPKRRIITALRDEARCSMLYVREMCICPLLCVVNGSRGARASRLVEDVALEEKIAAFA